MKFDKGLIMRVTVKTASEQSTLDTLPRLTFQQVFSTVRRLPTLYFDTPAAPCFGGCRLSFWKAMRDKRTW
jgi:hypothetical protein